MKQKQGKLGLIICLIIMLLGGVTACSKPQNKAKSGRQLPTARTILATAEQTKLKKMAATWTQTNAQSQVLQRVQAKYKKKPLLLYANFTTNTNHYQMWVQGKNSYVQMKGTSSKRWFKAKMTKTSSYAALTNSLAQSALFMFGNQTAKLFHVEKIANGYCVSYQGDNRQIWHEISQSASVASIVGIDLNNAKPERMTVQLNTDSSYHLMAALMKVNYRDEGKQRHFIMQVDQINRLANFNFPASIKKSAINLGALEKMK